MAFNTLIAQWVMRVTDNHLGVTREAKRDAIAGKRKGQSFDFSIL